MGAKPDKARSDTKKKSNAKQRNEEYLAYKRYIRSKAFRDNVKKVVEERDGHMCVTCGRTRNDGATLSCHHRVYDHLFANDQSEIDDCVTLCQWCHKGIHSIRSNYQRFKRKSGDKQQNCEGE